MNLIAVLPYCNKDLTLARNLLLWIGELGGCHNHTCLLASDSQVKQEDRDELTKIAKENFLHASTMICTVGQTPTYVQACNRMFALVANQIKSTCKLPFLWMEPDCTPMKKGWLDDLGYAYARAPRRYFGPIIRSDGAVSAPADIKQHLAAVSIYPPDAQTDLSPYLDGARCWDMAAHEFLPPRATDTRLISHFWPGPNNLATFKAQKTEEDPVNVLTPQRIWPEAVLFHQCKDGSLINVLRHQLIIPKDLSPDLKAVRQAKEK